MDSNSSNAPCFHKELQKGVATTLPTTINNNQNEKKKKKKIFTEEEHIHITSREFWTAFSVLYVHRKPIDFTFFFYPEVYAVRWLFTLLRSLWRNIIDLFRSIISIIHFISALFFSLFLSLSLPSPITAFALLPFSPAYSAGSSSLWQIRWAYWSRRSITKKLDECDPTTSGLNSLKIQHTMKQIEEHGCKSFCRLQFSRPSDAAADEIRITKVCNIYTP